MTKLPRAHRATRRIPSTERITLGKRIQRDRNIHKLIPAGWDNKFSHSLLLSLSVCSLLSSRCCVDLNTRARKLDTMRREIFWCFTVSWVSVAVFFFSFRESRMISYRITSTISLKSEWLWLFTRKELNNEESWSYFLITARGTAVCPKKKISTEIFKTSPMICV